MKDKNNPLRHLFVLFIWAFYIGVIYTGFNPEHAYLDLLDGARTVYLFLTIPMTILLAFLGVVMSGAKVNLKSKARNEALKMKTDNPEKYNKMVEEIKKMNRFNPTMYLGRLLTIAGIVCSFVLLKDNFLGFVMASSTLSCYIIYYNIKRLANEILDAIS